MAKLKEVLAENQTLKGKLSDLANFNKKTLKGKLARNSDGVVEVSLKKTEKNKNSAKYSLTDKARKGDTTISVKRNPKDKSKFSVTKKGKNSKISITVKGMKKDGRE